VQQNKEQSAASVKQRTRRAAACLYDGDAGLYDGDVGLHSTQYTERCQSKRFRLVLLATHE
jgi:hypothetical protein